MKFFYIALFAIYTLINQSCTVNKSVLLCSSCRGNCYYNNIAFGTSTQTKILGIGGYNQDALLFEAKRNLCRTFPLERGEFYDNYTIDYKSTNYIVYTKYQVIISADIVSEGIHDASEKYSEVYSLILNAGKVLSTEHINISDSVAILHNGQLIKGIVLDFIKNKASVLITQPNSSQVIRDFPKGNIFAIGNEDIEDQTNLESGQIIEYTSSNTNKGVTIVKEVVGLRKDKALISVTTNGKITYKVLPLAKLKSKK